MYYTYQIKTSWMFCPWSLIFSLNHLPQSSDKLFVTAIYCVSFCKKAIRTPAAIMPSHYLRAAYFLFWKFNTVWIRSRPLLLTLFEFNGFTITTYLVTHYGPPNSKKLLLPSRSLFFSKKNSWFVIVVALLN